MTLAEYLTAPVPSGTNCGVWAARWLKLSGVSDLVDRLDAGAMAHAERTGNVLALAEYVMEREGFRHVALPVVGMPVCVASPHGEAMGLWTGSFTAIVTDRSGVALGRWPVLAAWER